MQLAVFALGRSSSDAPSIEGFPAHLAAGGDHLIDAPLAIILSLLATLPGGWVLRRKYERRQDRHPSRWREQRLGTLVVLGAMPLCCLIWVWAITNGTPPSTMVGLVLAVGGGVFTFIGLFSRIRRCMIGMGVAMLACGLVMPGATDRQVGLAFALMFIVGATVSTAIAAWQLRAEESGHATH